MPSAYYLQLANDENVGFNTRAGAALNFDLKYLKTKKRS